MARSIEEQITQVRRYAVALTGDTVEGDRLVEKTLQYARLDCPDPADAGNLTVFLLTLLHRVRAGDPRAVQLEASGGSVRSRLQTLGEQERATLLLVTMVGLSYKQVESVLGLPRRAAVRNLMSARARLAGHSSETGQPHKDTRKG